MPITTFFKAYKNNTDGNFAITFAVSLLMLIAVVGAALDFSMAQSSRVKIQNAADSAVLAAAKSGETGQSALLGVAAEVVNTNNLTSGTLTTTLNLTANGRVRIDVSGQYDTYLMGIFGYPTVDIAVVSEAPLGASEPVNIALVLDTTGSMSGAKLGSLKTAANNLVDLLESYDNDSLKVSVVPFSQYVNVGVSRRNAPWIDVPADSSTTGLEVCRMRRDVVSRSNCRNETRTRYNDGVPYTYTRRVCDIEYGPEYRSCYTPTQNRRWHGCVGSRNTPHNERVAYDGREIPGLMNVRCGSELRPLTNDMGAVKSTINGLRARGLTYIPSGIAWGWRTLNNSEPFTEARGPYEANTQKVMIIMTDGDNTRSQNGNRHNGRNIANANQTTSRMCTNVKAGDIEVYTIAYEITNNATKNLMRNCATNSSMYFDASNAAQLNAAFEDIGRNLIKVRLTH
ncbi:MAG: VWA domain-containing protein [Robiginitomaculum sp.]|nr:VWA domain-containing protein [Robiginitomaculum sp.]